MPNRTGLNVAEARPSQSADKQIGTGDPVDVATIRATADRALIDGPLPKYEDLEYLEALLRGHINLLLPIAEEAVDRMWRGSVEWYDTRSFLDVVRENLREGLGTGLSSASVHVRQLGHDCRALLRYAEAGQ